MKTIVCVASGPSLTAADVDYCRGKASVLVVNDCYRLAPWADFMYAADVSWLGLNYQAIAAHFHGERWTQDAQAAEWYGMRYIRSMDEPGLSCDPLVIHQGENSGYQAVNLAYHLGAQRILLLGYDMGATGNSHWFGDHPPALCGLDELKTRAWPRWIAHFGKLAEGLAWAGVEVVNCTRSTNLGCFPRMTIEQAL